MRLNNFSGLILVTCITLLLFLLLLYVNRMLDKTRKPRQHHNVSLLITQSREALRKIHHNRESSQDARKVYSTGFSRDELAQLLNSIGNFLEDDQKQYVDACRFLYAARHVARITKSVVGIPWF